MNLIRSGLRGFDSAAKALNWIGYASIVAIIFITFIDVTGRYFFKKPLKGSVELIEFALPILATFTILYTTTQRGHIIVDILAARLSRRAQIILGSFGLLLGFATWAVIAYRTFLYGIERLGSARYSPIWEINEAPFILMLAVGLFLTCLAELIHALSPPSSKEKEGDSDV